jgi:hypothetical protein
MTLALIWSREAAGQPANEGDLRDPNPQERQILMHYREVIGKVLDQFQSDDWEEKIDYEITDDVSVSGDPTCPWTSTSSSSAPTQSAQARRCTRRKSLPLPKS